MDEFYDMNVRCDNKLKDIISMAKRLGFKGICISGDKVSKEVLEKLGEEGIDVIRGVEVSVRESDELRYVKRLRREFDVVIVNAESVSAIRKVIRIGSIILHISTPEGIIDQIIAKTAKENNVYVEFRFFDILNAYGLHRAEVFRKYKFNAKVVKKYSTPFVITSGAMDIWDMRAPHELISFGKALGFEINEAKRGLLGMLSFKR
ncbi:MAG TPA: hypothetical protein ENG42_01495 [Candidatus Aenigmarchaeota archaeon]|nr:hypothetical protein [Candidatus Aenigmarchaeota archaeon]